MFNTRWTKDVVRFCPHSGYRCSSHNDMDFSWLDRFVSVCSHLDWFSLGMGKYDQYISVTATCAFLGRERSRALPMFHSFNGCDTTSCFFCKGKKSTLDAWNSFPDVTEAFTFTPARSPLLPDGQGWFHLQTSGAIYIWRSSLRQGQQFDQCKWSPKINFHQKE